MIRFVLTRKRYNHRFTFGELSVEGHAFRCVTMERQDPRGQHPANPRFNYAVPAGVYNAYNRPYSYYPFSLAFTCKPYTHLHVMDSEAGLRAGCIGIGTKCVMNCRLEGFSQVIKGLNDFLRENYAEVQDGMTLEVRYADDYKECESDLASKEELYNFIEDDTIFE